MIYSEEDVAAAAATICGPWCGTECPEQHEEEK